MESNRELKDTLTIYTIAYNEEIMLPFMIDWYRKRFPECKIVVYDNYSTDNTEKIAIKNNCKIIKFDTNNEIRDDLYLEIKNNCWKNANTDWVLICDVDELLDITEIELINEKNLNNTVILSKGYNMYNLSLEEKIENMIHGVRASQYDKIYLFDKTKISEINYSPGCHDCKLKGKIKKSLQKYNLLHFSYLSENYVIEKYKRNFLRLSNINKKNNWGFHYKDNEKAIRDKFSVAKKWFSENKNLNPEEAFIWKK